MPELKPDPGRGRPAPRRVALLAIALCAAYGVLWFDRGAWTPDEPRDLAIAARMSDPGSSWAVPMLGDRPFCEKPPLWYASAAVGMRCFGRTPAAGRSANLAAAAIGFAALALLARRLAGPAAAVAAIGVLATTGLAIEVIGWARPDPMVFAAACVGLLGVDLALHGASGRARAAGWALLHAAIAAGFLAKSVAGPLVPALTLATLVVWERRWRALIAWPAWLGLVIEAAVIGPWIATLLAAGGSEEVHGFFGADLMGRIFPSEHGYTGGHRRWFGMYLVQAPFYLLPWTGVAACAAISAIGSIRRPDGDTTRASAYRFCIAAVVPAFIALSAAATKRDIYLGPLLPGVALAIAAWAVLEPRLREYEAWVLRSTAAAIVVGCLAAAIGVAVAEHRYPLRWQAGRWLVFAAASALLVALSGWTVAAIRPHPRRAAERAVLLLLAMLAGIGPFACRLLDQSQDYPAVARAAAEVARAHPLVLLHPDETIIGALDLYERLVPPRVATIADLTDIERREPSWVLVEGSDRGGKADQAAAAVATCDLRIAREIRLPYGRRYLLLRPRVDAVDPR